MADVVTCIARHGRLAQFMAIHTGNHGNVLLLPQMIPVSHRTMAHRTFHLGAQVFLMAEENKIRKLIQADPGKRLVVFLKLSEMPDLGAIGLDALMAGHTFRDAGDGELLAGPHGLMTPAALHSSLHMQLVTEGDRLQ
jgi:hypothetical protein